MKKRIAPILSILATCVALILGAASPASAAEASCETYGCLGLNPADTSCQYDAQTVAAMDVSGDGMLELRWSPSCNASWGRFTTYWMYDVTNSLAGTGISYARVTAWVPGTESYGVVGGNTLGVAGRSWWTAMVPATTTNCIGVELISSLPADWGSYTHSDSESQGWVWGPCIN